jgi:hypothetical protein
MQKIINDTKLCLVTNAKRMRTISALAILMTIGGLAHSGTISFSGHTWVVRQAGKGGPGPNYWDPDNVWVDASGYLHLRLTQREGKWYCAEVHTLTNFGFGRYQFSLIGRVDKLDRNVVLGLFNYPTSDIGPDGTHEIDVEFAQWGNSSAPNGNYTIWPTTTRARRESKSFSFALNEDSSTHTFTWTPTSVFFQSQHGHSDTTNAPIATWRYEPSDPATYVSRKPMPVHLNLWCCNGKPPSDSQPVELIVRAFKFTPL